MVARRVGDARRVTCVEPKWPVQASVPGEVTRKLAPKGELGRHLVRRPEAVYPMRDLPQTISLRMRAHRSPHGWRDCACTWPEPSLEARETGGKHERGGRHIGYRHSHATGSSTVRLLPNQAIAVGADVRSAQCGRMSGCLPPDLRRANEWSHVAQQGKSDFVEIDFEQPPISVATLRCERPVPRVFARGRGAPMVRSSGRHRGIICVGRRARERERGGEGEPWKARVHLAKSTRSLVFETLPYDRRLTVDQRFVSQKPKGADLNVCVRSPRPESARGGQRERCEGSRDHKLTRRAWPPYPH